MSTFSKIYAYLIFKIPVCTKQCKANKLTLNASKTKYMLFRKKQQSVNFESLKLFIDDKEIDRVGTGCKNESFKFVGINLDEYLTWSYHIKAIKTRHLLLFML